MTFNKTTALTASKTALLVAIALTMSACSTLGSNKKEKLAYVERPAEQIYRQGFEEMEQRDWDRAKLFFNEVERQHPFSKWARRSMLMTAYANYKSTNYEEAVATAQRFIGLHPGSDSAPYAYYLIAMSYYDQIYDVGRDQETTVNAEAALQQVVRRYPESDYAADARLKLELTHDHLAGKEMAVGRFYLKQNQQLAAIGRFKNVVRDYETTSQTEEALHRLVEAYVGLGIIGEAKMVGSVLGYNHPTSPWYADSYQLLAEYGVNLDEEIQKPRNRGYWSRLKERLF